MWIKFEQLTEERMLKNTTKTKRVNSNTPERSRSPEYFWKQLRSLLYKRVSKGNVMIGKIVFTRSLGFGIQFHVRKVFLLGGGNVAAESELELPVSCDLKFIKGIWKVIFFFKVDSEGSDFWVYSTSFITLWCCLVRKGLIEAVSELVWGLFKNHTEIDLEPMTLCNSAKQRKTMIYWARSDCPRAAISQIPLVHH